MMQREAVEQRVRELVSAQLRIDPELIAGEATLQSLGADSLDIVELVMHLEDEFSIEIKDEDAERIHSFHEMVDYIIAQQQMAKK